jgi:hypothetical protein
MKVTTVEPTSEMLENHPESKLLIIHADDVGMAHSVNKAAFAALEQHCVSSASTMVPCPWFKEAAAYAKAHPEMDFGVHLTLTSEWNFYRWGPVAPKDEVPSLIDPEGYFWSDVFSLNEHANLDQVELEIRCQVERALCLGLKPTHLDSHMFALMHDSRLFDVLVRVARQFRLGALAIPGSNLIKGERITIRRLYSMQPIVPFEQWDAAYGSILRGLRPGVNQINVHLGFNDAELQAITAGRRAWGANWREQDFRVVTSDWFQRLIRESDVRMVGWKDLPATAQVACEGMAVHGHQK